MDTRDVRSAADLEEQERRHSWTKRMSTASLMVKEAAWSTYKDSFSPKRFFASHFPLVNQLCHYKLPWIWKDLVAGIIVACFHIPQSLEKLRKGFLIDQQQVESSAIPIASKIFRFRHRPVIGRLRSVLRFLIYCPDFLVRKAMGTGMAANLGAMYGIYMTFFPGLIYAFMGTSAHNSVGAFAPTAALIGVGVARTRMISKAHGVMNSTGELTSFALTAPDHLQLAVTRTFCAGIIQVLLGILRLDFLSRLFSHNVLDPLNCACSLQIMLVQVPNMLGVPLPAYFGLNKHIKMLELLFRNITSIRWADTLFAILSASVIIAFREFLQPLLVRRVRLVVPIEFLVMVLATLISYCFDMSKKYGIILMGAMPVGIPAPSVPPFVGMPYPIFEGFLTALVSIAYSMQAAKILARKCSYEVSTSKELRAVGAANVFGSFFSCFVATSAVGRNLILEQMGSRSQLSSLFGCVVTGLLLAFASQTLYYLPFSVIATIITLTLAMSLKMFGDLPRLYRASKIDTAEWLITFIGCCLLDVEWGLLLGLLFSWAAIVFRSQRPRLIVLGKVSGSTGEYVPVKQDDKARQLSGIRILRIANSSIHYANAEFLLRKIVSLAAKNDDGRRKTRGSLSVAAVSTGVDNPLNQLANGRHSKSDITLSGPRAVPARCVILDFSLVSSVDSTGLRALEQLAVDLAKNDMMLFIAHCRERHMKKFEKYGLMKSIPRQNFVRYLEDGVTRAHQDGHWFKPLSENAESSLDQAESSAGFWNVAGMPVEGLEHGETFTMQSAAPLFPSPLELAFLPSTRSDSLYE